MQFTKLLLPPHTDIVLVMCVQDSIINEYFQTKVTLQSNAIMYSISVADASKISRMYPVWDSRADYM